MSLFFLPLALLAVLVILLVTLGSAVYGAIRSALRLREAKLEVTPHVVQPGEGMRVFAHLVPRRQGPALTVRATLTCTMFDHRARHLYANTVELTPVYGRPGEHVAFVTMPAYALRSGVVGDELSSLFSEDAHRLLIFWSMDFEATGADGATLLRESIPIEVPQGRPLQADRAVMDRLIVETCGAMHSDLIFNWMVKLAMTDGIIDPRERQLLRDVLHRGHGVFDPQAADARIAAESRRDLTVDPLVIQKYLPPEALVSFYRFLYVMAWRDGQLDDREHGFLLEVLETFGLDAPLVREVEREVLHGIGQASIR